MLETLFPVPGQTLTITNGSDAFSIAGIVLDENEITAGDQLSDGAMIIPIASIDASAGTGTLEFAWPGTSRSDYAVWYIWRNPATRISSAFAASQASKVSARQATIMGQAPVWRALTETNTPWTDPEEGDQYLVGPSPTGAWSAWAGLIVQRRNGQDVPVQPAINDAVAILGASAVKIYDGSTWEGGGGGTAASVSFSPAGSIAAEDVQAAIEELDTEKAALAGAAFSGDVSVPSINGGPLGGFRNLLINPMGRFNQRALASNADDTYCHDRWNILTQTGAVAGSTLTDVENGRPTMMRLTQSQASAQRMGISQIVESLNCKHLRGKPVTLSGRVRCSAAATIRYAILEWTGTADSVTSDVVNNWTSSAYTAGNFFLGSNLTVTAVGSRALAANTLTDLTALTGTLGSSMNNLIVFLWTEGTAAQNVTMDYALQIEQGTEATPPEVRSYVIEEQLCQRYFQDVCRGANNAIIPGWGAKTSGVTIDVPIYLPVPMRETPTISHSSPTWYSTAPGTNNGVAFFDFIDSYATISGALAVILNGFTRIGGFVRFAAGTSFSGTTGNIGHLYVGAANISLASEL